MAMRAFSSHRAMRLGECDALLRIAITMRDTKSQIDHDIDPVIFDSSHLSINCEDSAVSKRVEMTCFARVFFDAIRTFRSAMQDASFERIARMR
ncbi:MAG: hypothetical protein IT473_14840 [Lysobacter sp.]|nr:hypothetical protein [Lysobacter sp.]